ncbi:hypothetical protein EN852_004190 [Mesorhizobium sp. M2E.F.Ca.ET.209.01.1.1]|uniref:hypothetical protein n=1 Tax=Mesorhizobium sp. M2E.F.Ca.ET.209.01.1.1 TaxID=2500526 RepID=UPI000FD7990D|nr:hypothetical protein [Mesorhizobium sp. M2E.F.Ca.ET.209.01.1.1]TGS17845.1 hypothetical protein EN852_004190 [Mesorhizobium sp. M2E.F.Ca.ET.209.01.1.1]
MVHDLRHGNTQDPMPCPRHLDSALQVLSGGQFGMLQMSPAGKENGYKILERYAVFPGLDDPRVLIPLTGGAKARTAVLAQYGKGAGSRVSRLAAQMLSFESRLGLPLLSWGNRVSVVTDSLGAKDTPVHGFLADVLGTGDFVMSLRLAPGRPNSKPVIQAVSPRGQVLAYAKFGWDELTRRLVRHEAQFLRKLAPLCRESAVAIPTVLGSGPWRGLEALIVHQLPGRGRSPIVHTMLPAAAAIASLAPSPPKALAETRFWQEIRTLASQSSPLLSASVAAAVEHGWKTVEARWGGIVFPLGVSHGDWIPPNIQVLGGGRFNVWDWERGKIGVPLGLDIMQFVMFIEMRRLTKLPLMPRIIHVGRAALQSTGFNPDNAQPLAAISLLRSLLWFVESRFAGREESNCNEFATALASCLHFGAAGGAFETDLQNNDHDEKTERYQVS